MILWSMVRKNNLPLLFAVSCILALYIPAESVADVKSFSGDFEEGGRATIRFTVAEHSLVDFEFASLCINPVSFYLNGAYNMESDVGQNDDIVIQFSSYDIVDRVPLYAGDYIAELSCSGGVDSIPSQPEWTMDISMSRISIPEYEEDPEPASFTPVDVFSSRSFTGWLGLWGTPPAKTLILTNTGPTDWTPRT